jgi:hypothetical protein
MAMIIKIVAPRIWSQYVPPKDHNLTTGITMTNSVSAKYTASQIHKFQT